MRKGFFALGTLVALLAMALPAQATVIRARALHGLGHR